MKSILTRNGILIAVIAAVLLVGCGTNDSGSGMNANVSTEHSEGDGHDHGKPEHSHIGPHGGHLIELGANEAYHAELVKDENVVSIYILDGKAKGGISIAQSELVVNLVSAGHPQQFKLNAVTGGEKEPEGASYFQMESKELCAALGAEDFKGRLAVTIEGKQYVGEIEGHHHNQAAKADRNYQ
jgi:hypothetical protein